MNFKKIALALAVASSFSAQAADALAPLTQLTPFQADGYAISAAGQTSIYQDMVDAPSNAAYVFQSNGGAEAGSVAMVFQTGAADLVNYAAVTQSGMGALAVVSQTAGTTSGGSNKAMVTQLEEGANARTATLDSLGGPDSITAVSVDGLAIAELGARALSTTANAALVSQVGGALDNFAYIFQTGTQHFAAISQTSGGANNYAYAVQTGVGGFAYIVQK